MEWLVKDLNASHSPFVSQTEEVGEILREWAEVFEAR